MSAIGRQEVGGELGVLVDIAGELYDWNSIINCDLVKIVIFLKLLFIKNKNHSWDHYSAAGKVFALQCQPRFDPQNPIWYPRPARHDFWVQNQK